MAPPAFSSASAGPSSRKRKTPAADAPPTVGGSRSQTLQSLTGSLELGADSDEEDSDGHVALEGAACEEGDDQEEFPELDIGSSDEEDEAPAPPAPRSRRARRKAPSPTPAARRGDEADDEEDDLLEEDDGVIFTDEDSGSQSGYNSSDIDDDDGASPFGSPSTAATSLAGRSMRSASPVSRFLAEHTVKPDERDHALPEKPVDALAGVMTVSDLTGRPKRVYRDIEAGYGSESSTEDVCIARNQSASEP